MTGSDASSKSYSGGSALLRVLEARTAEHVFGLSGSASVSIFNEMPRSTLTFVASLQEGAAVAMADGYARIAGSTGVLLYMLPGAATGLSNLYNASRDESPLVVVVSQLSSRSRSGRAHVGEADVAEMVRPFVRSAREVSHPGQLVGSVDAAARRAAGPPSGPAVVVVPEDHLEARFTDAFELQDAARIPSVPSDLAMTVDRLLAAERPTIIVGGQLRRCGGSDAVEAIADELEIPVLYEPFWNDRLGVSPGHRCSLGQLTENSSLARDADVVVALGCRTFNEVHPRPDPWFRSDAFVAHVNADREKVGQSAEVSWSCVADPGHTSRALRDALSARDLDPDLRARRRRRLDEAAERRRRLRGAPFAEAVAALAGRLDHGYLVDESVSANFPLVAALRGSRGDRYISTTGGSLGWGAGAACGVALASESPVTCLLGDGAFFFGLPSLWQAVSLGLPVTFVVLDNGGFGSTRFFEDQYVSSLAGAHDRTSHYVGSDFGSHRPSIIDVARAFGLDASTVEACELSSVLDVPIARPRLVHVPIGHENHLSKER